MKKCKIGLHHIPAILLTQAGPDKAPASWQPPLHSQTPQHSHDPVLLLRGHHGHRLEEGALGYSIRKSSRQQNCILRFSPVFYRGTHIQIGRESSSSSHLHQWLGAPCSPATWTFVQPGVGFLPSLHLDGVSLLHRTLPPGWRRGRTNSHQSSTRFSQRRDQVVQSYGIHRIVSAFALRVYCLV